MEELNPQTVKYLHEKSRAMSRLDILAVTQELQEKYTFLRFSGYTHSELIYLISQAKENYEKIDTVKLYRESFT